MNTYQLARLMDCLLIDPEISSFGLIQMANVSKDYHIRSVICYSNGISVLKNALRNTDTAVNAMIGFPYGQQMINEKVYEANMCYQNGADEVSFVPSYLSIRDRNHTQIEEEMTRMLGVATRYGKKMNVVIDPSLFSADELSKISRMVKKYGFDSMMILSNGLTEDDLIIIRSTTNREIRLEVLGEMSFESMAALVKCGVSRFGMSRPEMIIRDYGDKYGR